MTNDEPVTLVIFGLGVVVYDVGTLFGRVHLGLRFSKKFIL